LQVHHVLIAQIVEGLGGTISVTSRLGEGTEVRIDLPVRTGTPA